MIYYPAITATALLSSTPTDSPLHGAESASEKLSRTTQAPLHHDLLRRAAPFRTCGYRRGDQRRPRTCSGTSVCVTDEFFGFAGCCDPERIESCQPATTCIHSITECNAECQSDSMTIKCFESPSTRCRKIYYDYETATFTELYCGTRRNNVTAFPTFGQLESGASGPIPITVALPAGSPLPDIAIENDDGADGANGDDGDDEGDEDDEDEDDEDGEDIDEDEDEIDDTDEEDEADDGDRLGNDDEMVGDEAAAASGADTTIDVRNESPDEESNSGDGSNTAAIVGGVLGGFAILGIIAVAFFYLILRHRRQRKRDELTARHANGSVKSDAADVADAADGPDIPISPTVVDEACATDIAATTPRSDDVIADIADTAEMGEPKVELPIQTESQEGLREVIGDTPETRHPAMKDGKEIYEAPGWELTS